MTLLEILQRFRAESSFFVPAYLEWDYYDDEIAYVDEVQLSEGRWAANMLTIVEFGGKLWGIEWSRGLTENQDDDFYPSESTVYEVDKVEKVVYTYTKKSS